MIATIAGREFKALFATPLPWILLALSQALLAWVFLSQVEAYQTQYQPLLATLGSGYGATELVVAVFLGDARLLVLLLLTVALLAMRLLAEERQGHTLPLLLAAPVSSLQLVLGKYLGGLAFVAVALLLWAAMPLSLLLGTALDLGRLAAALLGLALLAAALLALALWASALTARPGIAALVSFVAGLLLMALNRGAAGEAGALEYLGLLGHYQPFLQGWVNSADLAYFLLLIVAFLALAVRRLDALRVQA